MPKMTMSEPDESATAAGAVDLDLADIDESSYLRLVGSTLCEWRSAADAEAYDGLLETIGVAPSRDVIPGLTRGPS
ncbi:hypothetical protein [Bosea psychrotolerans]|uniref:Uncharacterized protein n=1 Tax=Bosea psychrotolerans TaxID=1871628 RepID=A0A2S4MPY4_9HYPH|nr:hypothetical protein [Bosea psychrotolerans]POR56751.1 hypothetical protein CYD53_101272 [Bosea psychrotolerans]